MPRPAALALGALTAALAASAHPAGALLLAGALSAAAQAVTRAGTPGPRTGTAPPWIAAGAWLVALRIVVGAVTGAGFPGGSVVPGAADLESTGRGETWAAEVVSVGSRAGGVQRAFLAAEVASGSLLVYARLPRYPEVGPGDRLELHGPVEPLPADPDPELAGFFAYLRRSGVVATAGVDRLVVVGARDDPAAGLARARSTAGDLLADLLPEPQAGLAAGILIGLRERVDRDVAAAFTAAGLSHVVAISGWNIAIVAGACGAVARRLERRRRALLVGAVVVAYTLAAGASASVVRAALMAGVVLIAREAGRRARVVEALGLAVTAMLVVDPAAVLDPGFQLSAAATAGLVAWANPLTARLAGLLPARAPRWLVETLGVSLAAQAATLPLVLVDFGRLSLVAPLANLLVAPVVAPAMAAAALALVAAWLVSLGVPALLATGPAAAAAFTLGLIVAIARAAAAIPLATVTLPPPAAAALAALAAAALSVVGVPGIRNATWRRPAGAQRSTEPPA